MAKDLKLKLILEAIDRVTAPMRRISARIRGMLEPLRAPLQRFDASMEKLGRRFRAFALQMAGVGVAGFAFKRVFIDTAAQFERYETMLRSLEGSNDAARKSMQWVSDFATRVPFELDDLMQAFVKLRTFGLDPTNGTLQALVDQSAKMGGSQELMQGIILAVGQAWTKQKLQGEEALQLIERGVPVWDLLAKATKLTAVQLQELSQKGKLGRGAIRLLIREMGKSSQGAALAQAKTWTGMVSMLSDQWTRFVNKIMGAGVFDWLKARLSGLLAQIDRLAETGRLDELARDIGQGMVQAFRELWAVLKDAGAVMRTVGAWLHGLRGLFGSWKPVIAGLAAVVAGPLLLSLVAATKAAVALTAALLTNPIGAAVAAIAVAALLIYKHWQPITAFFVDLWAGIKEVFNTGMQWLKRLLEYHPLGLLLKGFSKLAELIGFASPGVPSAAPGALGPPLPPLATAPGQTQVGGTIRVEVLDGRTRVKDVRAEGPVDVEADAGLMFGVP